MTALRVGGLFAGYGGVELALSQVLDVEPAWFSQYDPAGGERQAPSRILAHHWPDVPNHGDITRIDWSAVEPVDILTGGFPCQDVSSAGKRAGLAHGTRSGLWVYMHQAIEALRPRLVVIENVRGLLSAKAASDVESCPWCMGGAADGEPALRALGAVLGDLADIGYDAAWVGLPASGVGAPHGRFRIFVLAWPAADSDGIGQERTRDARVRWAGPADSGRPADLTPLLPTPVVNDMGAGYDPESWDAWTERMKGSHGNGNGHGASLHIEALRMLPTPRATRGGSATETLYGLGGERTDEERMQGQVVLMPTPTTQPTTGNGHARNLGTEARAEFGQYAPAIARWEAVIDRPAPSPTEPTGKADAHRLSPAFVEWMMGLPAGHVTDVPEITRNDMLKALGNGVVPQQAAEAVRWLLAVREDATHQVVAA